MTANTTYYAQWNCNADGYPYPACTAVGQTYTASSTYPWCNTPDKVICTCIGKAQTWPMCNVGSNTAGTTSVSYGSIFQWGRSNAPFLPIGSVPTIPWPMDITSANSVTGSFIIANLISPYDWLTSQDPNRWWGSSTTSSSWTFTTLGSPSAMQWPCANGYHVPTLKEWCDMSNVLQGLSWCNSIWNGSIIINTLQIPYAGARSAWNWSLINQGSYGWYWVSSYGQINSNYCMSVNFSWTYNPIADNACAVWETIRCIKN